MKNMGYQKAAASFLFQKTANDISRFGHCLRRFKLLFTVFCEKIFGVYKRLSGFEI